MRRILVLLFCVLLLFAPASIAEGQIILTDIDHFLRDNSSLLPAAESKYFDVSYTLSAGMPEADGKHWRIQYDLLLSNKTGKCLHDLIVVVHMTEAMQYVLSSAEWPFEPITLPAAKDGSLAHEVIYTRCPLVHIASLQQLTDITIDDFYTIAVEVSWHDGSETFLLTRELVSTVTLDMSEPYVAFTEETLRLLTK